MLRKLKFVTPSLAICAALMLSACSVTMPKAPHKLNYQDTLTTALNNLPCQSAAVKAPFDMQDADFMCTGGRFEQLYFRMDRNQHDVKSVKLHWKEYEKGAYLHERDTYIKPFLDFIAEIFLDKSYGFTYDLYFGDKSKSYSRDHVFLDYQTGEDVSPSGREYTIRNLEIHYCKTCDTVESADKEIQDN